MKFLLLSIMVLAGTPARADSGNGPDQATWIQFLENQGSPGVRSSHAMATDLATGKIYLFGGIGPLGEYLNDLWVWDGVRWKACPANVRPHPRSDAAMAYDPLRRSFILFGGTYYSSGPSGFSLDFADTWEWDLVREAWVLLLPQESPPAGSGHAMVTDPARNQLFLVGGVTTDNYNAIPESIGVWQWDGHKEIWKERGLERNSVAPSGRMNTSVAWDDHLAGLVLYEGGYVGMSDPQTGVGDHWIWNPLADSWVRMKNQGPALFAGSAWMANDVGQGPLILVGSPLNTMDDIENQTVIWELDVARGSWTPREVLQAPRSRTYTGLALDPVRGVIVLFGGYEDGRARGDTWECHRFRRKNASPARFHSNGCSCSIGESPSRRTGWPWMLLGLGIISSLRLRKKRV